MSTPQVKKLAREFAIHLWAQIADNVGRSEYRKRQGFKSTEDVFAEIRRRNETPKYKSGGLCASHDFCDANMPMFDAFTTAFGREWDFENEEENELVEAAWDLARACGFDREKVEAAP